MLWLVLSFFAGATSLVSALVGFSVFQPVDEDGRRPYPEFQKAALVVSAVALLVFVGALYLGVHELLAQGRAFDRD